MMDSMKTIFGDDALLTTWQMGARAAVVFCITLLFIRISGRRSFGQRSPFDAATTVLLGAVLSRGVVGASPFWATVAAAAVLALMHRAVGWLSVRSDAFDVFVSGRERLIVVDGLKLDHSIARALISDRDLAEAVRKKIGEFDLQRVRTATLERDGEISISAKAHA
jgi:uncharacterized membrane protein YcaP (DUF421 family)